MVITGSQYSTNGGSEFMNGIITMNTLKIPAYQTFEQLLSESRVFDRNSLLFLFFMTGYDKHLESHN